MTTDTVKLTAIEVELREFRARVADEFKSVRHDLGKLEGALHGPPTDTSVRGRLHKLESDDAAARAASAALEAVRLAQRQTFSTFEKAGLFAFAGVATAATVLRWFGVG